jgi:hypothetical protein
MLREILKIGGIKASAWGNAGMKEAFQAAAKNADSDAVILSNPSDNRKSALFFD